MTDSWVRLESNVRNRNVLSQVGRSHRTIVNDLDDTNLEIRHQLPSNARQPNATSSTERRVFVRVVTER